MEATVELHNLIRGMFNSCFVYEFSRGRRKMISSDMRASFVDGDRKQTNGKGERFAFAGVRIAGPVKALMCAFPSIFMEPIRFSR